MKTNRTGRSAVGCVLAIVATIATAAPAAAQQAPATLTLDEALELARRYSPAFRQQANDEGVAHWNLRSAYGQLLPSASIGGGVDWRAGGSRRIENIDLGGAPDEMSSGYRLGVSMSLSGATLFGLAQARAESRATEARIDAAAYVLEANVTRQYLTAKRAHDAVALAERDLATADAALQLVEARIAAGAAARVDASQAIVERGRAEVGLIQAQAAEQMERLLLLELLGLDIGDQIVLTSEFEVFAPTWTLEQLTASAMAEHPQLEAARAGEAAGRAGARAARMSYLPSLSISGGWSGYTQMTMDEDYLIGAAQGNAVSQIESCEWTNDLYARLANPLPPQDCSRFAFTDEDRQSILAGNGMFPFDFTKAPPSFSMGISLPLFNGFQREANVQRAAAAADDAKHQRREAELRLRAALATAWLGLNTAYSTVAVEERNVAAAEEQLQLQQERYRLGAGTLLELTQAQAAMARARQAQLEALYSFHENLAALEAAVGRPLR
ncbi:MAG: TolC family protein [Gemmatimonadota bacterium]